jgi:hypothetical protein
MYHNDYMLLRLAEERQRDLMRELEHDRLVREAKRANHAQPHKVYHMLDWVGRQLVRWGERLQAQHALYHQQTLNRTLGG